MPHFSQKWVLFSKPYPTLSSSLNSGPDSTTPFQSQTLVTFSIAFITTRQTCFLSPRVLVPLKARAFSFLLLCAQNSRLACSSPPPHCPPYPLLASLLFNLRPRTWPILLQQNALTWNGMHLKTECQTLQAERLWGSRNLGKFMFPCLRGQDQDRLLPNCF